MKIDSDPLQIEAKYTESIEIYMVKVTEDLEVNMVDVTDDLEVNMVKFTEDLLIEVEMEVCENYEEQMKVFQPREDEELIYFQNRCKLKDSKVMLCPRCSVIFDKKFH